MKIGNAAEEIEQRKSRIQKISEYGCTYKIFDKLKIIYYDST